MPSRVDIGGSKKPSSEKASSKSASSGDSKGNAIKLGVAIGAIVLAGVILVLQFMPEKAPPPPPPLTQDQLLQEVPEADRAKVKQQLELQDKQMEKYTPSSS